MIKENMLRSAKADSFKYVRTHNRPIDINYCLAPLAINTKGSGGIRTYTLPMIEDNIQQSSFKDPANGTVGLILERYILGRGPVRLFGESIVGGELLGFTLSGDTASSSAISTDFKVPVPVTHGQIIEVRTVVNFKRIIKLTQQVIEVFDQMTTDRFTNIKFALVRLTSPYSPAICYKKIDNTPIDFDPYNFVEYRAANFTDITGNYFPVSNSTGNSNTTASIQSFGVINECTMIVFGLDNGTSLAFWIDHPTEARNFKKGTQFTLAWNYETKVSAL